MTVTMSMGVVAAVGQSGSTWPDAVPAWVDTVGGVGVVMLILWFVVSGKLRLDREVAAAEKRADAAELRTEAALRAAEGWQQAHQLEVEARRNAEAAARHIMTTDNVVVNLVEALKRGPGQ